MLSVLTINMFCSSILSIIILKCINKPIDDVFPVILIPVTWDIISYLIYGNTIPYNVYKVNGTIIVGTAHCNKYKTLSKDIQKMVEGSDNFYNEISPIKKSTHVKSISIDTINKLPEDFSIQLLKENLIKVTDKKTIIKSLYFRSSFFYSSSFLISLKKTKLFENRNIEEDFFLIKSIMSFADKLNTIDIYPIFLGKNNVQLDKIDGLIEKEEINQTRKDSLDIIHNEKSRLPQFLNEFLALIDTLNLFQFKWIDIFLGSFIHQQKDKLIVNKRNDIWLPKIRESIDGSMKTSIFVGNNHLSGIIKELKKDYDVKKWNYFSRKFE